MSQVAPPPRLAYLKSAKREIFNTNIIIKAHSATINNKKHTNSVLQMLIFVYIYQSTYHIYY